MKKKPEKKKKIILVYCGPTIPHTCDRYAMFEDVPEALKLKAQELPMINDLIVPITELRDARLQIEGKVGPLYSIYKKINTSI